MSSVLKTVDSLEHNVNELVKKLDDLEQKNVKLTQDLLHSREKLKEMETTISEWDQKYQSLKIANSMLGSDDNKKEAKLKINTLIREIDYCIAQLAE